MNMAVCRTIAELRDELAPRRAEVIGFVPTMGSLHDGHLALLRMARDTSDVVVLSIFVNPLQFGPREDFGSYPRDEARDLELATEAGTDVAFVPHVEEIYPPGHSTTVSVSGVSEPLEGVARPGHFVGVATVVAKLFNIVQPDKAFFGQKDAQQLAVIRKMVADLSIPIVVVAHPTVREQGGLALSSRNAYLDPEQRDRARILSRALSAGRSAVSGGPDAAVAAMQEVLATVPDARVDYAAAVDPDSFGPPEQNKPILLALAVRIGTTRLIDNVLVEPE